MKIAIVGGTGDLGRGLAKRLSKSYTVYIGSRDKEKAQRVASQLSNASVLGLHNKEACELCDVAIITIPYEQISYLSSLRDSLAGKLVVSSVVPLGFRQGCFYYKSSKSAAEEVASILDRSRVCSAFHTLPAGRLAEDEPIDSDTFVACDSIESYSLVAGIAKTIENIRPIYSGPLVNSRYLESMTVALLNVSRFSKIKEPVIKINSK